MGKLIHYAHSVYQAFQDTKIRPKSDARKGIIFAFVYPPLHMLHRMGFGNWTSEQQAEFRSQYYGMFPEQYTLGDLVFDLRETGKSIARRCVDEVRYIIPSATERRQMAENLRRQREASPAPMGMMQFDSFEDACASRGAYLEYMHLINSLRGRFAMSEQK